MRSRGFQPIRKSITGIPRAHYSQHMARSVYSYIVETSTVPDYTLLFSRNIMSEERLVEGVRGLVCLWDCKAKSYKDQTTRENAWKEVAALVS